MAKPTYQAASIRLAAPLVLVVLAVVEGFSGVMLRTVKVEEPDELVIVLVVREPVLVLLTVLFLPVVEARWLLLVLVPAADVLTLESATVELVGFARMGKLELLA